VIKFAVDFENVWLGFMSKTPRWRLSGEALSYTFGAEAVGAQWGEGCDSGRSVQVAFGKR
jgi:hypothetical protein